MSRLRAALFAGLLFVTVAAAPAGKPGCSCAVPPRTGTVNPVAPAPPAVAGTLQPIDLGVRRPSPALYAVGTPPPTVEPMRYRDSVSGMTLRFDADGQHVCGVDGSGNELWRVNVFDSASLKGRELDGKRLWPTITFAGPAQPWMVASAAGRGKRGEYVAVGMNTKEGGLIDVRTGEYLTMGND